MQLLPVTVVLTVFRKSLTDLNLRGNHLAEVLNLHRLPQLQNLDLGEFNNLCWSTCADLLR